MFIVNYGLSIELNTQNQANINDLKEDNVRRRGLLKNIDEQIALMIGVAFLILWLAGIIPTWFNDACEGNAFESCENIEGF